MVISTLNEIGSVELEKFTSGSGIWASDFFNEPIFSDLIKMYKFFHTNSGIITNKNALDEYNMDFNEDSLKSFFVNKDEKVIFVMNQRGYYAYLAFINDVLELISIHDNSTDEQVYPIED